MAGAIVQVVGGQTLCSMSCGFEYEGEINLAVVDRDRVAASRLAIWQRLLCSDTRLTGKIDNDVKIWEAHAAKNADFDNDIAPSPVRFVYPFVPESQRVRIVGRDVT